VDIRTLQQAFNAVFHNKETFSDFHSIEPSEHVTEFTVRGRAVVSTSKKFRSYLRFIDKVVLRHLAINDEVVHSYLRNKSVLTAASAHAGNRAFFLTDIESFFSRITRNDVVRILSRDAHAMPIRDIENYIPHIASLTTYQAALPIGFPTSPQISNGFLYEFDNALHVRCKEQGLTYTRYADDIIISAQCKDDVSQLRELVQAFLSRYASKQLVINAEKTRITHIGNKVKILGLIITPDGRVTIDSKHKRTLESLLHLYLTDTDKYQDLLGKVFEDKDKEHSLYGLLHYVKATDPLYLQKLQRKYGVLAVRTLMENRWHAH